MHDVLDAGDMLADELVQRRESGYDVSGVEGFVRDALDAASPAEIERAHEALEATDLRDDWPYVEPTALEDIRRRSRRCLSCLRCAWTTTPFATGSSARGSGDVRGATSASGRGVAP